MTSGSDATVSMTLLPGKSRFASSDASAMPGGSITAVAASAVRMVKPVFPQRSAGIACLRVRDGGRDGAHDVEALQHFDPSRGAAVAWRDDSERALRRGQRLSVHGVRDDDLVGCEGGIELG